MEFRVLGALEIREQGVSLPIGRPRTRAVLGILLTAPNTLFSVDRLVDELWPDQPPDDVRKLVHGSVSQVRRALRHGTGDHSAAHNLAQRLVTRQPGYLLRLDDHELDRHRYEQLLTRARAATHTGALPTALAHYREAGQLWRGTPFADVPPTAAITATATVLTELHLTSLEEQFHIALQLGCHAELLSELTGLVALHPARERLVGHLMRALHHAGCTAEALDTYQQTRRHLADRLGIDPGPELQQLHLAILRGDTTVTPAAVPAVTPAAVPAVTPAAVPAAAPAASPSPARPAQLPADLATFTGRDHELDHLLATHPASGDSRPAATVISTIDGMAGIGKTALAVHAAHRLAAHYPDGQLFLDLHGFTPTVPPVEPGDALDRMLRALGIPGAQIPAELDDRAGLWRSTLANRRMLILLDNAATETQVDPLLPGAPGCLVLVTSRRRLVGLDNTQPLSIDILPLPDAATLFTRLAGPAHQPPELVAETVELCGRLPQAIRIAAARLRSRPTWSLTDLANRLRDQQHRLAELTTGQRSVTAAMEVSYQQLTADQQRTYRLLGLHPGPDLEPHAAAALANTDLNRAQRLLDQLLDTHLLQEATAGRFTFHDLTRAHAAGVAARDEAPTERHAALTRLLDHYRHSASVAMDTAYAYEREMRPRVPPADTPTPDLPDPDQAAAWLDTELPNLLAAARFAADHQLPPYTLHLSSTLHRHLNTRSRYLEAEALHRTALAAARATGNRRGEADALISLGDIEGQQGRYQSAAAQFQDALATAYATGHQAGELIARAGLGHVHRLQGRYQSAAEQFGQVLDLARTTGNRLSELSALIGLGDIHRRQGRYQPAGEHFEQVLDIARTTGNHGIELTALHCLAIVHWAQGRDQPAVDTFERALSVARAAGNRVVELAVLSFLGRIHRRQGRRDQAAGKYQQVLDLAREVGSRNWQFEAIQGLGCLNLATGRPHLALTCHQQALDLATELGQPNDEARAQDGIAHAYHALDQPEPARRHWQRALQILTTVGIDHTEDEETSVSAIRAHLAGLDQP